MPPGAGGVFCLPYFLGEKTPINDPEATGAFVGLQLTQSRGHLFRAVLEGIAYGFRHHLEVFAERGHRPLRARVTDGGSRSRVWTQITADVLGIPLEKVTLRSGSAFAAAFCAGMGVGAFSDWRDVDRFVAVDEVIEPHPDDVYERGLPALPGSVPGPQGGADMSVLVTGAGCGIGEATARLLAARGEKVAVTDVDAAAAARVGEAVGTVHLQLDVRSRESIRAAIAAAETALGPLERLGLQRRRLVDDLVLGHAR